MALFRGIQEYIALDANNITLVFDSGNIVSISGNIFLYPPQGHPILYIYLPTFLDDVEDCEFLFLQRILDVKFAADLIDSVHYSLINRKLDIVIMFMREITKENIENNHVKLKIPL